jgi:glutamine synthetase
MHDLSGMYGLSELGQHFVAGIMHYLPALAAITAPAVASYFRLTPNRWAPTWANLGRQDRGAGVRICPVFAPAAEDPARQFNVEYRVADAAASPYLALGAIVYAGLDGIREKRLLSPPPTSDFWEMSDAEREGAGVRPLPHSLDQALDNLATTDVARDWFGELFFDVYLCFKRAERRAIESLSAAEICARYADVY